LREVDSCKVGVGYAKFEPIGAIGKLDFPLHVAHRHSSGCTLIDP
jgi:hypothetical protein